MNAAPSAWRGGDRTPTPRLVRYLALEADETKSGGGGSGGGAGNQGGGGGASSGGRHHANVATTRHALELVAFRRQCAWFSESVYCGLTGASPSSADGGGGHDADGANRDDAEQKEGEEEEAPGRVRLYELDGDDGDAAGLHNPDEATGDGGAFLVCN